MSSLHIRNVRIGSHRTSVRLERALWDALDDICRREQKSVRAICSEIAERRRPGGFTSALRVFILDYYRSRVPEENRLA